jgi:hypothetical protein
MTGISSPEQTLVPSSEQLDLLQHTRSPLEDLSRQVVMDEFGYYVEGGMSPYAVGLLKPLKDFLHAGGPNAPKDIYEYIQWMHSQGINLKTYVDKLRPVEVATTKIVANPSGFGSRMTAAVFAIVNRLHPSEPKV